MNHNRAIRGILNLNRPYTNARFAENVALYRRLGYRIDREEESALGVTVYMSKRLADG